MFLPVGDSIDVPVELICPTADPPVMVEARLRAFSGEQCDIELTAPEPGLEVGARVVLTVAREDGLRLLGAVTAVNGTTIELDVGRPTRQDKRDYPRVDGGVDMRYRVLGEGEDDRTAHAWLHGLSEVDDDDAWHEPDPYMNVSGSGLRFQDDKHCETGDLLLVDLDVPTFEGRVRSVARVVRTERARSRRSHYIAAQFEHLPSEAREALTRFTLLQQHAELGPLLSD